MTDHGAAAQTAAEATCQVRETLIAAEPHMRAMFDAEAES